MFAGKIFPKERSLLLFWRKLPDSYALSNGENFIVSKQVACRLLAPAVLDSVKTETTISYPERNVMECSLVHFWALLKYVVLYFHCCSMLSRSKKEALLEQSNLDFFKVCIYHLSTFITELHHAEKYNFYLDRFYWSQQHHLDQWLQVCQ